MKKIFTLLAISLSIGAFAQEFSGKATYQTKQVLKMKNPKPEHETPEFKRQLEAINKSMEKTHFLEFTQYESVYTEEEKLPTEFKDANGNTASISMRASWTKIYKNLKENYFLMDMDDYIVKILCIIPAGNFLPRVNKSEIIRFTKLPEPLNLKKRIIISFRWLTKNLKIVFIRLGTHPKFQYQTDRKNLAVYRD